MHLQLAALYRGSSDSWIISYWMSRLMKPTGRWLFVHTYLISRSSSEQMYTARCRIWNASGLL